MIAWILFKGNQTRKVLKYKLKQLSLSLRSCKLHQLIIHQIKNHKTNYYA